MNRAISWHSSTRREILKTSAAVMAGASLVSETLTARASDANEAAPAKSIGIQVGAVSFVDEGANPVLDILQERGAVNTIFLTTFTYGRGLAGRQIPGQPFPDHGVQESDEKTFHGGNYARPHAEFYRDTVLWLASKASARFFRASTLAFRQGRTAGRRRRTTRTPPSLPRSWPGRMA